jgi:predicted nucleic acid-binding protein
VDEHPLLPVVSLTIDAGEAEAICLALELKADVILLDDRKGKREAESRGLSCLALPAILLEAKLQGLIPPLKDTLNLLDERGSYRLKAHAIEALLRESGEFR